MADQLEYVVKDALMMCDKGAAPGFFMPLWNMKTKISGCLVTTKMDKLPLINIPSFGICAATQAPCVPVPTEWQKTYKVKVRGQETLLFRSCMQCGLSGKIEFVTSGQIPLPPEALEDIKAMQEAVAEEEEEGWGWLDTLELVPVVGSIVGAVREGMKGNWGMMAMNIGFLAMDVAGLVTLGATTVAATAAKTSVKAGVKIAAKTAVKTAAKTIGKTGLKTETKLFAKGAAKAFKSSIDDIAKAASSKKPVTAIDKSFRRSMSERRKALLRDAKDPDSKLSDRARKFILENDGKKVPKGYEVSHEKPLYNAKTNKGKKDLDIEDNMKTERKSTHRKRHKECGNQYHEFGPSNKPKFYID